MSPSLAFGGGALFWRALVLFGLCGLGQAFLSGGNTDVCCAFLPTGGGFQLFCSKTQNIPGSQPFPTGTRFGANLIPGVIAQCVGKFPRPPPGTAYINTVLFRTPNGARCAGQFTNFFQALGRDGAFITLCSKAAGSRSARAASKAASKAALEALAAGEAEVPPELQSILMPLPNITLAGDEA